MTTTREFPIAYRVSDADSEMYEAKRLVERIASQIADAEKAAKRSPKKWTPIVETLTKAHQDATMNLVRLTQIAEAETSAYRAGVVAIFDQVASEILSTTDLDGFEVIHRGEMNFEVRNPDDDQFRFSVDVYGPREQFTFRGEEPRKIHPAYPKWGSYSNMTSVEAARVSIRMYVVATNIAERINETFGL